MKKLYILISGAILCQTLSLNCLAAGIVLDGNTTPDHNPASLTADSNGVINIDASVGKGSGDNLFHSFQEFNVGNGQTAEFTDSTSSSYSNVIALVTGNNSSEIFGTIHTGTGLENANLYLINPNGILFGNGASVSVGGAFYASTADTVHFADNTRLELKLINNKVNFSSAPISAFGFTDVSNATEVSIKDVSLNFTNDAAIYADNIRIEKGADSANASGIQVDNGSLTLVATAQNTNYQLAAPNGTPVTNDAGAIEMNGATVSLNGDRNIVLRGGKLTLTNNSNITLNSSGADLGDLGPRLQIGLADKLDIDHSMILSTTSLGISGDIDINAREIDINAQGRIVNGVPGITRAVISTGDININTERLSIVGETQNENPDAIYTAGETGIAVNAGKRPDSSSGTINIFAKDIIMANNAKISGTNSGANAGDINLTQTSANGSLSMNSGAQINFYSLGSSRSPASGANINIGFSNVSISGADVYTDANGAAIDAALTQISNTSVNAVAGGGDIFIDAQTFRLSQSARISTTSSIDGSGGSVFISAASIDIGGFSSAFRDFVVQGNYDLAIGAGIVVNHSGSDIDSGPLGGNVALTADSIDIHDYGYITVVDDQGGPYTNAGNISLSANTIRLTDHAAISSSSYLLNTSAPTGNIQIHAADNLYIGNSTVSTNLISPEGNSGNIDIFASQLAIVRSRIDTSANSGNGGNITIDGNFGIISADTVIDASSKESVSGNISISNNIQHDTRVGLSIDSGKNESIVLSDLCSVNNGDQSSLTMINNNRPLRLEENQNFSTTMNYSSHLELLSVNECLRPALKVSLL